MKYLSLFSGIGGFELGITKAYVATTRREALGRIEKNQARASETGEGLESKAREGTGDQRGWDSDSAPDRTDEGPPTCVGYSEIDKYATDIYQKHFPKHKNYGDITKINERELPDFDLIVGGFPCQAFSIAGKRGGFADTRGTLFFEIARIVRHKKPRLLLLENVRGLLSHDNGKTFRTIISTLDELGYDIQWQVLNSKNFGVPQNRERVYIVGHLRGTPRPEIFPFRESNSTHLEEITRGVSDAQRIYNPRGLGKSQKALGGGLGAKTGLYAIPEATKKGYAIARPGDSINLSVPNSKTRRGRVGGGIAQTVDTGMQQCTIQDCRIRRLTPVECERLMAYPDGWTEGLSDTQRYKTLGNGVVSNVVQKIVERML